MAKKEQPQKKSHQQQRPQQQQRQEVRRGPTSDPVPGVIEEIVGRTGTRGGIIQVRVRVMDGPDKGKVLRRNIKGAIREGDILILRETEIEARSLNQPKRGKKK